MRLRTADRKVECVVDLKEVHTTGFYYAHRMDRQTLDDARVADDSGSPADPAEDAGA